MSTHEQFLAEVEAFLADAGISASRFGKQAIGDPNFVIDLRGGRTPSLRTADKVRKAMREFHRLPANRTESAA